MGAFSPGDRPPVHPGYATRRGDRPRRTVRALRMPDQPKTADDVKAICEERSVRFIRFWFTDILGQLKSFSINVAEIDDAFEGGMGFDGSSITGFNAIGGAD